MSDQADPGNLVRWLSSARTRWRREILALWGLAFFLVVAASLTPNVGPPGVFQLDKVVHALAYGSLTLVPVALDLRIGGRIALAPILVFTAGVFVEVVQAYWIATRSGSPGDVAANAAGTIAGAWLGLRLGLMFEQQRPS